ncbi:MAG: DUF1801 domain-containing protein [Planctomycetes bacterium]|nr:DUF1801 domain-containing protein [Planctomycetota bacterium]
MTPKKPAKGAKPSAGRATPAGKRIDQRIRDLADWRGATLARMRALVLSADRSIIEEWKWNNPVWSHGAHGGILCTGEAYAKVVKLTFARGAALADPAELFNASLTGNTRRAIDIREGERIDARAFKALVKSAMALHATGTTPKKSSSPKKEPAQPRLLSGGNPQIAKADGDLAVQAYIAAMPGWKQAVGRRIDAVATRALANVPGARKAVKWNSPFYGVEGQGWLLSFHCFTKYVKVAFFNGASLRPPPPGPSKSDDTRYLDVHEHDSLDETQLAAWIQQAAALPGWGKG